jgi:hypothetical protein
MEGDDDGRWKDLLDLVEANLVDSTDIPYFPADISTALQKRETLLQIPPPDPYCLTPRFAINPPPNRHPLLRRAH